MSDTGDALWLIHVNDRKLLPFVHRAAFGDDALQLESDARYGANIFADSSELLTVRRPLKQGQRLDDVVDSSIRAGRLVAWCAKAPGSFRPLDTPPFPSRGWSFALLGDSPPEEQRFADEREALACNRDWRGRNTVELLALRVIYRIHKEAPGRRLRNPNPDSIRQTLVDAIEPLIGDGFQRFTAVLSNHDVGLVYNRGRDVSYRTLRGDYRRAFHGHYDGPWYDHLRAAVVTDGLGTGEGAGWKPIPDGGVLKVVDRRADLM